MEKHLKRGSIKLRPQDKRIKDLRMYEEVFGFTIIGDIKDIKEEGGKVCVHVANIPLRIIRTYLKRLDKRG